MITNRYKLLLVSCFGFFTSPLIIIVLFYFINLSVQAQKNDTVYLMNGDRVTGEFKKFDYGILTLKTDGMSTLSIEYDKIKTAHSTKYFEIIDRDGFTYFGSVGYSGTAGNIGILVSNGTIEKPIREIVKVTPIKNIFWKKFYGSVDFGVSYYKSTDILQYNFNTDINYRSKKNLISFSLSSIFTDQFASDSSDITRKNDLGLDFNRYFTGKWWGGVGGKVQQNTSLNLDRRLQLGVGAGYDLVHTNPVRFYLMGGILANSEKTLDTNTISTNLEGLISLKFSWLQYRHPKIDISTNIDFYPSITIAKRYRLEYDLSAKYELFKDFYLGLTFYDNFDSKPTNGGPALNDWGTTLSIGYSF